MTINKLAIIGGSGLYDVEEFKKRVIQLGESPNRIKVVGGMGIDSIENLNLFEVIQSDKYIMSKISPKKLRTIFSYAKHFKNVNLIFRRVFK